MTAIVPCDIVTKSEREEGVSRCQRWFATMFTRPALGRRRCCSPTGLAATRTCGGTLSPAFEDRFQVVLFDHVGCRRFRPESLRSEKYSSLAGYADDVVEIGNELDLKNAVFVGHSVSAMIGALASLKAPGMFRSLVMVGRRLAISMTKAMSAASRNSRSPSSWSFSPTITWAGLRPWRR